MSALAEKQTYALQLMSALPPKADRFPVVVAKAEQEAF